MRRNGEKPDVQQVSDQTIGDLQALSQKWMENEISWNEYQNQVKRRGWGVSGISHLYGEDVTRGIKRAQRFKPGPIEQLKASFEFMRELGKGVIKFLDPLGGTHDVQVGKEEGNE